MDADAKERRDLQNGQRVIRRLTALLGKPVVLIPIYPRSKRPRFRRFQTFILAYMENEQYIACVGRQGCNVAVLLGRPSGGLCTLDFDDDANAEEFLRYNPRFRETLATTAKRGRNLWFWILGDYPVSFDLTSDEPASLNSRGESERAPNVFEFRATGRNTLISGTNPFGWSYRFVHRAQPIKLRWDEIVWPEAWRHRVRFWLGGAYLDCKVGGGLSTLLRNWMPTVAAPAITTP